MSSAPHLTSFNAKDALDAGFCLSTLSVDHDVHHALSEFKRLSVYSLPVVDKEGVCLGLVDLGDMVFHLVSCFFKSANVATPEQLVSVSTTELDGVAIEAAFNSTPIATLLNCSGANPYSPLPSDTTTIADAITALTKSRRLPLIDPAGKVVAIISQTNVIRFLAKHHNLVPESIAHKPIADLNAVTRPLLSIPDSLRAIDAFAILAVKQFSAVGITATGESETIATLSVKDMPFIASSFTYTVAPVEDFVKAIRQHNLHTIYPTIGCANTASLTDVINRLGATKLHRLLVHPAGSSEGYDGVISLGNIIKVIASHL